MNYKKLAQATGKTPEQVMREMYEKGLIDKDENLRIRLSDLYFGNYNSYPEKIEVERIVRVAIKLEDARLSYK